MRYKFCCCACQSPADVRCDSVVTALNLLVALNGLTVDICYLLTAKSAIYPTQVCILAYRDTFFVPSMDK